MKETFKISEVNETNFKQENSSIYNITLRTIDNAN